MHIERICSTRQSILKNTNMMLLTSWINEEYGDKDLLDRREKVIQEFKSAGDDVSKLRRLMPKVKSINAEIERLTIVRKNRKATT